MKLVAYLRNTQYSNTFKSSIEVLKQMGCSIVHSEDSDGFYRLAWKRFIKDLECGDTAVFVSLEDAFRNFTDLRFFIRYCQKREIVIKSIEDGIDTSNVAVGNMLSAITRLPLLTDEHNSLAKDFEADMEINKFQVRQLKKHQMVINMYNAGHSLKEIMSKSGYRSKSSIYRVIHLYNMELEYPAMSRKKAEN